MGNTLVLPYGSSVPVHRVPQLMLNKRGP